MDSITKLAQMGMEVAPNPITDTVSILQGMQEQLFQLRDSVEAAMASVAQMLSVMQQPMQPNPTAELFSTKQTPMPAQPASMPVAPDQQMPAPPMSPLETY